MWNGQILAINFPELYSFAIQKNISAQKVIQTDQLHQLFSLLLLEAAYQQFLHVQELLNSGIDVDGKDTWSYIWGSDHFSAQKAYKYMLGHIQVHPAIRWLWGSSCQLKHKVFFWLILNDRVNTRGLLKQRNMHLDSYARELCIMQREETLQHLFLRCSFARRCWRLVGIKYPRTIQAMTSFSLFKKKLRVKFAVEIIILMTWSIWTARND